VSRGVLVAWRVWGDAAAVPREPTQHGPFGQFNRHARPNRIRIEMRVAGLLHCEDCGRASDHRASGWAAFTGEDPDGVEPTSVVILCPVCAAREFEWRPEAAAEGDV
jgi:hypothetical protein